MPIIVSLLSKDKMETAGVDFPKGWAFRFLESITDEEIILASQGADCLFVPASAAMLSDRVLENIPSIKLIQTFGAGFDHIDIAATIRMKIPVANVPGQNAVSVAEFAIGSIIALQRRFIESDAEIKSGNYLNFRNNLLRKGTQEIYGSKIGLIGFGAIGQKVARIAQNLGAEVSYHALHRRSREIESQFQFKSLECLLLTSDIVSLHIPLTELSRGLLGQRELKLMKEGSFLINTARGEIVDQIALAKVLEAGHLAGAAIDTFYPEIPGPDHPLLNLSPLAQRRLLVTPHIAWATTGSFQRMIETAIVNMKRVLRGEIPENIVNGISERV